MSEDPEAPESPATEEQARRAQVTRRFGEIREELREAQALLGTVIANAPIVLWSVDTRGVFTLSLGRELATLGLAQGQVVGSNVFDMFDVPHIRRALAGEELTATVDMGELTFETMYRPLRDPVGAVTGVLGVSTNITERRRAEREQAKLQAQLFQAQKMEAVGALAAGVAHDFNNILSIVLSYASFVLDRLKLDDPVRAQVEEIGKAGERAVHLTRQLLAFGRQQPVVPRVVSLDEITRGLEKMLRCVAGEAVDLTFVPAQALGMVRADPGHLEQVIMNLVVNARDAMPGGGRITLETANVDVDEVYASANPGLAPGPHVVIAVSDNGTGMDASTRERIFEPFFTTKDNGKGTGLGLSVVYGIVRQSGGHVQVCSEPGKGSTFTVYLPRTDEDVDESILPPPSRTMLRGSETILLVESDEQLRAIEATVLRRNGYNVIEAQNAGEAFLACERHQGAIALLLTEIVMPRMNGMELAARLAPMQPQMSILYVSDGVDGALVHEEAIASRAYLQKPITPDSLLNKVRERLDLHALQTSGGARLSTRQ